MAAISIDQVRDYTTRFGQEPMHPLVTIIDLDEVSYTATGRAASLQFYCYAIFLKGAGKVHLRYGRQTYDYQEGTLIFFAPGQLVDISDDGPDYQASGQAILFHPDLLLGTPLAGSMHEYHFFNYAVSEALHLSEEERQLARGSFERIRYELSRDIDRHTRRLVVSILEMLLNYCDRFYDRQFATRDVGHAGILAAFERQLNEYYHSEAPQELGPATVNYFAGQNHVSPNYFGDIIKRETGRSAQEHIQAKMIAVAKEKLFAPNATVNEVAYALGFEHAQHFSRVFKRRVGIAPGGFKAS